MDPETLVTPSENPSPGVECPECGAELPNKLRLGLHRWREHGVQGTAKGSAGHKGPKRAPVQPRGPRQPSARTLVMNNVRMVYGFGSVLAMPLLPATGKATQQNLDAIAAAWGDMSDEQWVRDLWGGAGAATKWGGLVFAHLPVAVAVAADVSARRARRMAGPEVEPVYVEPETVPGEAAA